MTYVLYKYQAGKKIYLSTTGNWIKTAGSAWCLRKEEAYAKAAEIGCCVRAYSFRN